jgi:hypothetical protein
VGGEVVQESGRYFETAGSAVQGQAIPRVELFESARSGKVGGIEEDPVEPTKPVVEVGADTLDGDAGAFGECAGDDQRLTVPVRRYGPTAGHRRGDREEAIARSDVEQPRAGPDPGEWEEQCGVLARRVDLRRGHRLSFPVALP